MKRDNRHGFFTLLKAAPTLLLPRRRAAAGRLAFLTGIFLAAVLISLSDINLHSQSTGFDFSKLPLNNWVNIGAANTPLERDGWTSWVLDEANGKAMTFGNNGDGSYQAYANDVWIYDISGNAWTKMRHSDPWTRTSADCVAPVDHPAMGHPANGIAFDLVNRVFIQHGLINPCLRDDRTWAFNHLLNTYSNLRPSGPSPGATVEHSIVYDKANKVVVLFGGQVAGSQQNMTWVYDPAANKWTQKIATNYNDPDLPEARTLHAMDYDSTRKKVVMFGGSGFRSGRLNDLWTYDVASNKWQRINASNPPSARDYAAISYDSANDILLLFGGQDGSGRLFDTWAFNFKTNSWSQISPPTSPTGVTITTMDTLIYDPVRNVHLLWTNSGVWAYRFGGGMPSQPSSPPPAPSAIATITSGPQGGHYLSYKGRPFFIVGDSVTQAWAQNRDFNYRAWIDDLAQRGINAAMIWSFMAARQKSDGTVIEPRWGRIVDQVQPWRRTGSGTAKDGLPAWNLDDLNDEYFARLKDLIAYAANRDIIVLITIWDGWAKDFDYHPFNTANGGPLNSGDEFVVLHDYNNEMPQSFSSSWSRAQKNQYFQEKFVRRLLAETASFSNVMFEIFNEGEWYDQSALAAHQRHWIDFIKKRSTAPIIINQDHVSSSFRGTSGVSLLSYHGRSTAAQLFARFQGLFQASPVLPALMSEPVPGYPPSSADEVRESAWGVAMAGGGYFEQDDTAWKFDPKATVPDGSLGRSYLGHLAQFFNSGSVNFWRMYPDSSIASTGIALFEPGVEYVIYSPSGAAGFTLNLSDGIGKSFSGRWYNPRNGTYAIQGLSIAGAASVSFAKPDSQDWVLHLVAQNSPLIDTTPPTISMLAPPDGSKVSGSITISADATDNVAVAGVQFKIDGVDLGPEDTTPPYSLLWDTTTVSNGNHTITAVARDTSNLTASASVSVIVDNGSASPDTAPPNISAVAALNITSSEATIAWSTDEPSDSQVEYGPTPAYGFSTSVDGSLVTSHSQTLSGLAAGTRYHFRVKSRDASGNLAVSQDFTFVTLGAGTPAQLNVPLTIQEALPSGVSGVDRKQEPVTVGIPLPDSAGISSASQLGLTGASRGQFRILARWPSGNAKWVLVDTLADVSAGGTNGSIALINGSGDFGGPPMAADSGAFITVDTGAAQFTIRKSGFNLFDEVVVKGKGLVAPGTSKGVVLVDPNGVEYTSANDAGSSVSIEENGPVRSAIVAKGSLLDASGRRYADYTVRMHFYATKAKAKVVFTLRNASNKNIANIEFKNVDLHTKLALGAGLGFEFAKASGTVSRSFTSPSEEAHIYQAYSDFPIIVFASDFGAGGDRAYAPHIRQTNPNPGTDPRNWAFAEEGYEIVQGGIPIVALNTAGVSTRSHKPKGWADFRDGSGAGLTVGIRYMAGRWPKALAGDGSGNVAVGLWPKYKKTNGYNNPANTYWFPFGNHETNEVLYEFHDSSTTASAKDNAIKAFDYPLVARPTNFEWVRDSGALEGYDLVTAAEETQFYSSLGLTPQPFNHRFGVVHNHNYRAGGGDNQHDLRLEALLQWLRRGGKFAEGYLYAQEYARHNADKAIKHSDDFAGARDPFSLPNSDKIGFSPFDGEHKHAQHLPYYYFLSGDERIKEGIYDYGDSVGGGLTWARVLANDIKDKTLMWRFMENIGDKANAQLWLSRLDALIDQLLKSSVQNLPDGQSYANLPNGIHRQRGFYKPSDGISPKINGAPTTLSTVSSLLHGHYLTEALWYYVRLRPLAGPSPLVEETQDLLLGWGYFHNNEFWHERNGGINIQDYGNQDLNHAPEYSDAFIASQDPSYAYLNNHFANNQDNIYSILIPYNFTGRTENLKRAEKYLKKLIANGNCSATSSINNFWWCNHEAVQHMAFLRVKNIVPPKHVKLSDLKWTYKGSGTFELSWTVPPGATDYILKYSNRPIVEHHGFNDEDVPGTFDDDGLRTFDGTGTVVPPRTYKYDPDKYWAWWDSLNLKTIPNPPQPAAAGTVQTFTITGLPDDPHLSFAGKAIIGGTRSSASPSPSSPSSPPPPSPPPPTPPSSSDTTPPTVSITFPAPDSILIGIIKVKATASDNVGVVGVQFKLNGNNLGPEDTRAPYEADWNTANNGPGTYTLTAVARDAAGNSATSAPVEVIVKGSTSTLDTVPPSVSITWPSANSTVSGSVMVRALATDNVGVVGVQFRLDGNNLGPEDTTPPYEFNWNTASVENGPHTLTAVARDAAGNRTTSPPVGVIVSNGTSSGGEGSDTAPPKISNVFVSNITANSAVINWTTDEPADAQVEYGLTTAYGNATPVDPEMGLSHSVALAGLSANTTYHFRVKSKDAAGNRGVSGNFTFRTQAKSNGDGETSSEITLIFQEVNDNPVNNTEDAYISLNSSSTNTGSSTDLWVENANGAPNSVVLIRFPNIFGSNPGQIPPGATIKSAILELTLWNTGDPVSAYRLLQPWSEGSVTWNSRGAGLGLWANPGAQPPGSRSSTIESTNVTTGSAGTKTFDVTEAVRAWAANPSSNYGVTLQQTTQNTGNGVHFRSSEHSVLRERPKLKVTFIKPGSQAGLANGGPDGN